MFQLVAPIAAIGLFFKGQWGAGFSIILGLIFTYGMRFYGIWLSTLEEKRMSNGRFQASDVVDVEGESEVVEEELEQLEEPPDNVEESEDEDVKFET